MNAGLYVKEILEDQGRSQRWLSEKIQKYVPELDEKKLSYKLLKDSLTPVEFILCCYYLGKSVDELTEKILKNSEINLDK